MPVTSPQRAQVIADLVDAVLVLRADRVRRVGIDGVDGAGKTVLADELADALRSRDVRVIRASIDGFHHPPEIRYRRGRSSPEGFFRDSYDLERLSTLLLAPLAPGGDRRFVRAVYDVRREQPLVAPVETADAGDVLIVDGIFLHRDELVDAWDLSVFLEVRFEVSVPRGAGRGSGSPDPTAASNRRYVEGQRLYLSTCQPERRASLVIDNDDLSHPVVRAGGRPAVP